MRPKWTEAEFWGMDIKGTSNIIFSNGLLDPLHRASPLESLSDSLIAIQIAEGAHHLDLRSANPADPPSVRYARYLEIKEIMKWIEQAKSTN